MYTAIWWTYNRLTVTQGSLTYRTSSPAKSNTLVIVILEDSLGFSFCCKDAVEGLLGSSVPAVDVDYNRYKKKLCTII